MTPIPPGSSPGDPARTSAIIEWCELMGNQPYVIHSQNHIWLVAIGIAESNLDNLAIGNNAANGTPSKIIGNDRYGLPIDVQYSLGLGWLQHDSGWLEREGVVNGVEWTVERIREDPLESLRLLIDRPGFVLYDNYGTQIIDLSAWNAYSKAKKYVREVAGIYHQVTA